MPLQTQISTGNSEILSHQYLSHQPLQDNVVAQLKGCYQIPDDKPVRGIVYEPKSTYVKAYQSIEQQLVKSGIDPYNKFIRTTASFKLPEYFDNGTLTIVPTKEGKGFQTILTFAEGLPPICYQSQTRIKESLPIAILLAMLPKEALRSIEANKPLICISQNIDRINNIEDSRMLSLCLKDGVIKAEVVQVSPKSKNENASDYSGSYDIRRAQLRQQSLVDSANVFFILDK